MRILLVSTFFPPRHSIASLRPYCFAKYWARLGHDVTVLTEPKSGDLFLDHNYSCSEFKLIEVEGWLNASKVKKSFHSTKKTTFLKTMLNSLREKTGIFSSMRMPDRTQIWIRPAVYRMLKEKPFDLVVSTSGPFTTHVVAHHLKSKRHAEKWIADYQDPWIYNFNYKGLFPINYLEKFYEKYLMKSVDTVTTVSQGFGEMIKRNLPNIDLHIIENGFDPEEMDALPQIIKVKEDKWRLLYTGSLYFKNNRMNVEPLFLAIEELKREESALLENFEVLFAGHHQEKMEALIARYHLSDYVKHIGLVSRKEALIMQREVQGLLFFPWNDLNTAGVLTGKLYEYLASETPIIAIGAAHMDPAQELIIKARAGTLCPSKEEIKIYLKKRLKTKKIDRLKRDISVVQQRSYSYLSEKILELV